ncbi:MAG: hypothetical protein NZ929_03460 [Aigarchaeota archaeon]|nr:hypothetical protein [Aigarchaeota archaeon]MCX8192373.1 hypothetical protein [Nitrososphaeria archaeon]MDW7986958.1 hypothetical protein [Nitrososphaerota archaeon]
MVRAQKKSAVRQRRHTRHTEEAVEKAKSERHVLPSIDYIKRPSIEDKESVEEYRRKIFLRKSSNNPLITPIRLNYWEAYQTFNSGAILLDNKIHLIYRAIGIDGISRFGYAVSKCGFKIDERLPQPIYQRKMEKLSYNPSSSGGGFGGCEDPRIVKIDEDKRIYVTYNAFGPGELRVGLTSISIDDFLNKRWRWSEEKLISPPGEVHKNFVIFPEKINGRYAILHSISPRIRVTYLDSLSFSNGERINSYYIPNSNGNGWEAVVKSPGPPPIKTDEGWLLLYHGLSKKEPWKYKIGMMLLDLDNPEKILAVSRYPVIEPDQAYENTGFKPGVVYTNGAIVKDGELIVYYGSADTYVSVAHAPLDEILDILRREKELTKDIEKEKLLAFNGFVNKII